MQASLFPVFVLSWERKSLFKKKHIDFFPKFLFLRSKVD